MTRPTVPENADPWRMRRFAGFFRNYMGLSTVVVAALPIPVNLAKLIPMHRPDAGSTTVLTSFVCFLLFSFIFYNRHDIAKVMFPEIMASAAGVASFAEGEDAMPVPRNPGWARKMIVSFTIFLLIASSVILFLGYYSTWLRFEPYLAQAASPAGTAPLAGEQGVRLQLMAYYVGFFAFAEMAFVLMATKEYMQDLLLVSDTDLIRGAEAAATAATSPAAVPADPEPAPAAAS